MIQQMYTIYDSAAGYYLPPFTCRSDGEAIRDFGNTAQDPKAGQLYQHPADFTLFKIGEYDNATGAISQLAAKQNLGTALDIRSRMKKPEMETVNP